ncbi:MAG: PKD domain-containing protein [Hymenobacter sp.]|nr:MAG: PKD domain-containing protein [Hymenobacter sp.]
MQIRYFLPLLTGLTCLGCAKSEPEAPYSHAADFSYAGTLQNTTPIAFSSTSPDAKSYSWDFGDGTAPSTDRQPTHTFRKVGTYPVRLTVESPGGLISQTQTLQLLAADTLSPIFARVVGKYHISKSVDIVYDQSGLGSYTISRNSDITISRSDNSLLLNTDYSLPIKAALTAAPPYQKKYVFSYVGYNEQFSFTFSPTAPDSISYNLTYYNIPGGHGANITYYGKKI